MFILVRPVAQGADEPTLSPHSSKILTAHLQMESLPSASSPSRTADRRWGSAKREGECNQAEKASSHDSPPARRHWQQTTPTHQLIYLKNTSPRDSQDRWHA